MSQKTHRIFYAVIKGSLNNGIFGGTKVKIKNKMPIKQIKVNADSEYLQRNFCSLKSLYSKLKRTAAETKNIEMFIQSGDFPKTPL